jgi:hypothetical protein
MHDLIEVAQLPDRADEIAVRLRQGERFLVGTGGTPIAALVSLAELADLDETDTVLADQGLLDALREARAVAGEDPSDYDP